MEMHTRHAVYEAMEDAAELKNAPPLAQLEAYPYDDGRIVVRLAAQHRAPFGPSWAVVRTADEDFVGGWRATRRCSVCQSFWTEDTEAPQDFAHKYCGDYFVGCTGEWAQPSA